MRSISEWFHSREKKELYTFNEGVFEAYPAADKNEYWNHFTHKVPYTNYKEVIVSETPGGCYMLVNKNQTKPEWN